MGVATFKQPDYTTMSDSTDYPLAIDASVAVLAEMAAGFAVHEREPPDLRVTMDAGKVIDDETGIPVVIAAQDTAVLAAPLVDPRHDVVFLDKDNVIGVAEGAEAGAPADPILPSGATAKARIRWSVGAAQIDNSMLDDLRVAAGGPPVGLVPLAEVSTSTPVTSLDLVTGFSDDFDAYHVELVEIRGAVAGRGRCQVRQVGGSFVNSGYLSNIWRAGLNSPADEIYTGVNPTTHFILTSSNIIVPQERNAWSGWLRFHDFRQSGVPTGPVLAGFTSYGVGVSGAMASARVSGYLDQDLAVDGLSVTIEGGDIIDGALHLYGIKKP